MSGIDKKDIDLKNNTLHIKRNVVVVKKRDSKDATIVSGYEKNYKTVQKHIQVIE